MVILILVSFNFGGLSILAIINTNCFDCFLSYGFGSLLIRKGNSNAFDSGWDRDGAVQGGILWEKYWEKKERTRNSS